MSKNYKKQENNYNKYASSYQSSGSRSFELKDKYQTSKDSIQPSPSIGEKLDKNDKAEEIRNQEAETSQASVPSSSAEKIKTADEVIEDVNVLGAKLIKAELFGDQELIASLKARLEVARQKSDAQKQANKQNENSSTKSGSGSSSGHHQKHRDQKHHGQNQKNEQNRGNSANQKRSFRNRQEPDDEDENIGDSIKKIKSQNTSEKSASNSTQPSTVETCHYCFDNAQKHLIVSMGKYCYLSLPSMESLVEGNCLIVPMSHQSSSITCDEEIWNEIQDYKKALVKMFRSKGSDCVFFEQYNSERRLGHMIIECMPLEYDVSNMAPLYFKKAILESESEWAQNKQIIDLKKQGLRKSIPRNMPYFSVNFGIEDGYAHVIENSESFPDHFAKEIIGGILDLDPMKWRRPKKDDLTQQSRKVLEFSKTWKGFDYISAK